MTQPDINSPANELAPEPRSTPQKASAQESFTSAAWELVQTVVLALVLFLLIRNVIQNFRIDGISMEPNFHNGQFLIVNRFAYCPGLHLDIGPLNIHLEKTWCIRQPNRGDVIVFEYPKDLSRDFIKRVIALPGETIEVSGGKIYINGQMMPEPFGPNPGSSTNGPITVGPSEVFVMGDNRNNSSDSRTWGSLPLKYVIGKALLSYWPPRYWAVVPRYDLTDLSASSP